MTASPPFFGDWPVDQTAIVGPSGPAGPPGATGAPGATGPAGPAGVPGDDGLDGSDGRTVLTTSGPPDNALGLNGDYAYDPSATIMYGPKTAGAWTIPGTQLSGSSGSSGNTVLTTSGAPSSATGRNGDFAYDPGAQIMYGPKSGGAWGIGTLISGADGAQGPAGATGAQGPAGATGAQGPAGNTVLTTSGPPSNAIGANGDYAYDPVATRMYGPKAAGAWPAGVLLAGPAGGSGNTVRTTSGVPLDSVGVNGDFAYDPTAAIMYGPKAGGTWPAGVLLKGPTGADGPAGATGAQGPAGATGAQGPAGTTGAQGPAGATGAQGPAGTTGAQGPAGNTVLTTSGPPSNAIGANGDYAYDPAATRMYGPKAAGAWPAGVLLAGPAGSNGNTVRTTSGVPLDTVGVNGDFAYDPATQTMYGPKAGGAWPAGVLLKGSTGATGSTGPAGSTGSTGATGPTGPTVELSGYIVTRTGNATCNVGPGSMFTSAGDLVSNVGTSPLNLANTGLSGRGSPAAEAANTWYYVHAWHKTGAGGGVQYTFDVSATAPTPVSPFIAGESTLIGAVRNDASSNLIPFFVEYHGGFRRVSWDVGRNDILGGGTATSFTTVDLSAWVPPVLASSAILFCGVNPDVTGTGLHLTISGKTTDVHQVWGGDDVAGNSFCSNILTMPLYGQSTPLIQYKVETNKAWIWCVGYEYSIF